MSFWNTIASLLTAALSLLGFVHANPTLPKTTQDQAVQVVQQAVTQATNAIASSSSPTQTPATAMKTYSSGNEFGFQFSYPASFTLTEYPVDYDQNGYATWSVGLSSPADPLLNVGVTEEASPDAVANCDNDTYNDKLSDVPGTSIVKNGITFYAGMTEDLGAGSFDEGDVDAVAHNGNCYQVVSDTHGPSAANEVEAGVTSSEIDASEQAGQNIIDQIASTFQFTTVEPGAGGGPDSGGAPGMSGGSGACQTFAHLKVGDTDASVGGQQVSALQMDLGVTPATGVYGPKTQIAYQNECGGSNVPPISVAGMNRYTDFDSGFSFWYPNSWHVILGQDSLELDDSKGADTDLGIQVEAPSNGKLFLPVFACGPAAGCADLTYFFDSTTGAWMMQDGLSTPTLADVSTNTMGGLHMLSGNLRFGLGTVVPLSAGTYLFVSAAPGGLGGGENGIQDYLASTIVANDPSVGLRESTEQQTATIQAEQQAYAGQ